MRGQKNTFDTNIPTRSTFTARRMSEGVKRGNITRETAYAKAEIINHLLLVDQIAMCFRKQFVVLKEIKTER